MDLSRNKIKIICQNENFGFSFFYIKSNNKLIASKTVMEKSSFSHMEKLNKTFVRLGV